MPKCVSFTRRKMANFEHGLGARQETENDLISHSADLFRLPQVEGSMLDGRTTVHYPIERGDTKDSQNFTFKIPSQGAQYFMISATRLFMRLSVQRATGVDLHAADKVAPVTGILGSLFKSVDVEVNGLPVPQLSNNYAMYKDYIEHLITFDKGVNEGHLQCSRFYMDEKLKFDVFDDTNEGFKNRSAMCAGSVQFDVMGPLNCDLTQVCVNGEKYFFLLDFQTCFSSSATSFFFQDLS